MMILKKADIDQLLEKTTELADDDYNYLVKYIEIDTLLEKTADW